MLNNIQIDTDFDTSSRVVTAYKEYAKKPTKKQVLKDLEQKQQKTKIKAIQEFKPKEMLIYSYAFGWERGFKVKFQTENCNFENLQTDEPLNGFRKIYKL